MEDRDQGMVKLLMTWNIRPGSESDYFEFFIREFAPGLLKLGIQASDAWYTYYGEPPQILAGAVAEDLESMQRALATEDWQQLKTRLMAYVTDYRQKIVRATGGFQL
jgi:hypothetical protein